MKQNRKIKSAKNLDTTLILFLALLFFCCFCLFSFSGLNNNEETKVLGWQSNLISKDSKIHNDLSNSNSLEKTYKAIKVIDGDTLELEEIGKVRLIGIDSPELNNPKECYAEESTQKLKELVLNQSLKIEYDLSQGEKDKYDRALLYIFNEAGVNINLEMINLGFGYEYTYNKAYKYILEFKNAQNSASLNKLGLWNKNTCNGSKTLHTIQQVVIPFPESTNIPIVNSYKCDCSKTCSNLSCQEAQFQLNICSCSARDGDKDGLACDSKCQ